MRKSILEESLYGSFSPRKYRSFWLITWCKSYIMIGDICLYIHVCIPMYRISSVNVIHTMDKTPNLLLLYQSKYKRTPICSIHTGTFMAPILPVAIINSSLLPASMADGGNHAALRVPRSKCKIMTRPICNLLFHVWKYRTIIILNFWVYFVSSVFQYPFDTCDMFKQIQPTGMGIHLNILQSLQHYAKMDIENNHSWHRILIIIRLFGIIHQLIKITTLLHSLVVELLIMHYIIHYL